MLFDLHRTTAWCGRPFLLVAFERGGTPYCLWFPNLQKQGEAGHGNDRCADVHEPWSVVIRNQELRNRETHTGYQDSRPYLLHAPPPGERPDKPERHQQREKWKLAANHR